MQSRQKGNWENWSGPGPFLYLLFSYQIVNKHNIFHECEHMVPTCPSWAVHSNIIFPIYMYHLPVVTQYCAMYVHIHSEDFYSLLNVIGADGKWTSFYQYLRYNHKRGTIVFSTPSAIIWAYSHVSSTICHRIRLFEHVIYSWGALHCRQCRAPQE